MKRALAACLVAPAFLAGCVSMSQPRQEDEPPQRVNVGWIKRDWRVCNEDECPKPTPKTVVITPPQAQVAIKPIEPPKQTVTVREPVVVHFDFAKAVPVGDWKHALETVERQVAPSDSLLIKAYTDDLGSERYNDRLARQRAAFVLSQLKALGIKNPMEVKAKGKCCYVAPNDTDAGRAANRRAEVHFITPKEINK
ncbi:OmpA family protein [Thiobacter aerophilum]|uniref:OmpA family protein n=1 Tax=Thiobacter aerophilum TaxID=3121275 RepID=A0ABV0EGG7_9BURK